ncbi:uncharacterized protein LOC144436930 [Glandiceps talaboti]
MEVRNNSLSFMNLSHEENSAFLESSDATLQNFTWLDINLFAVSEPNVANASYQNSSMWFEFDLFDASSPNVTMGVDIQLHELTKAELILLIIIAVVMLPVNIIGIIGNLTVCWVVATVKKLRTPANIQLVTLAVADLLIFLVPCPKLIFSVFYVLVLSQTDALTVDDTVYMCICIHSLANTYLRAPQAISDPGEIVLAKALYLTMTDTSVKWVVPWKSKRTATIRFSITRITSLSDEDMIIKQTQLQLRQISNVCNHCQITQSVPYKYNARLVTVELDLSFKKRLKQGVNPAKYFFSEVRRRWCQKASRGRQLWLSTDDSKVYHQSRIKPIHTDIRVKTVSFGAFKDRGTYCNHYESDNTHLESTKLQFEYDNKLLSLAMQPKEESSNSSSANHPYRLELYDNEIEKFFLVEDTDDALYLYIPVKRPPRLSQVANSANNWERTLSFPGCSSEIIGNSSVLRLSIVDIDSRTSVNEGLSLLQAKHFKVYFTALHKLCCVEKTNSSELKFREFETKYSLACLLSRGYLITDNLDLFSEDVRRSMSLYPEDILTKAFYQLATDIESDRFIDISKQYEYLLRQFSRHVDEEAEIKYLPPTCRYVRRMMATPSRLLFLQSELMFENRVLRNFGEENCVRLVFRDEDYHKLPYFIVSKEIEERIRAILKSGIDVDRRHYEFLACSNSQLRDHGCWLYAKDNNGNTAASIRQWMGDFSQIRCVPKYVARMGQCFSTSEESVRVTVGEGKVHYIYEIKSGIDPDGKPYCFSDGIGKISKPLAFKIWQSLRGSNGPCPSAFQIRYGGCKGVVAIDTEIQGEKLQLRPSMRKFTCDHSSVEIMDKASPGRLYLNRQSITILSGLGIPDKIFHRMQDQMLCQLTQTFLLEDVAASSLSERTRLEIKFKEIQECGISLTTEPFFKALLQVVFKICLDNIRRKARIEIPPEYGRNMIGVLDETGTLRYGQVFIQYSKKLDKPQKPCQIHTGPVVVTKFPCYHPGDVRKFEAIDVPALHHLIDCIVFPRQGPRPHPNEMSGSDLDGDKYFVTWLPDLIFSRRNHPPMDFPGSKNVQLPRPVEVSDMIGFVVQYIKCDSFGKMSNAHLAKADEDEDGIFSKLCIDIARILAKAIDFAKTGSRAPLQKNQKPHRYPDFMEKRHKETYDSKRILGQLFRQCQAVENVLIPALKLSTEGGHKADKKRQLEVDPQLEFTYQQINYTNYASSAKISRDRYNHQLLLIMNQYGVESEVEAVSGCITKLSKRITERNEQYDTEKIIRLKVANLIKVTRNEFFAEFRDDADFVDARESEYGTPMKKSTRREYNRQLAKASAWYWVTYSQPYPWLISFPWVVSDLLGEIKSRSPVTLTNDPLVENITSQLAQRVIEDKFELIANYLHRDGISQTVKQYLVTYPCLLQVIHVTLKWARTCKLIHIGDPANNYTVNQNTLVMFLMKFARRERYIEDHLPTDVDLHRKWKELVDCVQESHVIGNTLRRRSPSHVLLFFLQHCSKMMYDESIKNEMLQLPGCRNISDHQMSSVFGKAALSAFYRLAQTGDIESVIDLEFAS